MSDEEEKKIEPAPEQPLKKKKPDAKPEDKQASWSDHKQAELGEIPKKIEEWFGETSLGKHYKENTDRLRDNLESVAQNAVEGVRKFISSAFNPKEDSKDSSPITPSPEQGKDTLEDDNALAPMTSAQSASSPIPEANLAELNKLGPNASSTEPSPSPIKLDEDVNKTL